ncbi:MAG: flagellar biosynthesis protein FliQ [Planctomycetes bacterium]|nr:flagellar biosynthesis protein FliQ [Planctomycetota bacterium]
MDSTQAVDLARQAVMLLLMVAAPVLIAGMVVGVTISVLQAVTQVQEQTLSFVPKIIAMLLVAVSITPWAGERLLTFTRQMLGTLP